MNNNNIILEQDIENELLQFINNRLENASDIIKTSYISFMKETIKLAEVNKNKKFTRLEILQICNDCINQFDIGLKDIN